VMQMTVLIHFVITPELRTDDDGGIPAEIGMAFYPVEKLADRCVNFLDEKGVFICSAVYD